MRQRIRETQPLWTYNYTADYITERVAASSSNPMTFGYRANDTTCEAGNYTTVRSFTEEAVSSRLAAISTLTISGRRRGCKVV